ncbi:hypothetical protein B7494_g8365 [Chlorociboria aeruginascens]|nr:hypothetical protein B7494_g8365 [Chlorociboria aeruginascens]
MSKTLLLLQGEITLELALDDENNMLQALAYPHKRFEYFVYFWKHRSEIEAIMSRNDDEESIDEDTVMSNPGESDIEDAAIYHLTSYYYPLLFVTKQKAPAIKSRSHMINTSKKTNPKDKPNGQHDTDKDKEKKHVGSYYYPSLPDTKHIAKLKIRN